jgi:thiol:disulfide interchange protein DsbD
MKKLFIFCAFLAITFSVNAQMPDPVKWTFEAVKKADKQYDIVITANVNAPWHIYAQTVTTGPVPTTISFKANPLVKLVGKPKEFGKLDKAYDKNFGAEISSYMGQVQFKQAIVLKAASKTKLSGSIEYMVCNDSKCLPPKSISFEVAIQ